MEPALLLPNRKPDGKIRFGLNASTQHTAWPEYRKLCIEAEAMGYDSFWVWDHFIPGPSDANGTSLECFTTISALAAITSKILLGTLVVGVTYRNPGHLAKLSTMVDQFSDGRFILGTGAAWYKREHEMYGIPFPPPGERVRRENETLEIVRRLWTQETTTFEGRYYHMDAALNAPKPIQQPYPPILVGSRGDMGLKVVARHADAHNSAQDVASIAAIHARLDAACAELGRDPKTIERTAIVLQAVGATPELEATKRAGLEALFSSPFETMANRVLYGPPEQIVEQLRRYTDIGITHFMFSQFAPFDLDGMKLMAEKVLPHFR